ncbi:MAG: hypothetical protein COB93_05110 [Sneathiella sp.]|nr:MAG: hypothetical protein COB93_05110 [Sneathiella sp.]
MKLSTAFMTATALCMMAAPAALADDTTYPMGFFITSVGMGDGANLGGLDGADAYCTKLAEGAGTTGRTWKAYLSTQEEGKRGVSARGRIGTGPWYNSRSELIAVNIEELHLNPNISKRTALDQDGNYVNGRSDKPNEHDILTGSMADGTAYFPWEKGDKTCGNWTSNGEGSATVGHHDRNGGGNTSWNAAHDSRGCSQDNLKSTGGAGLLYCFAAD